MYFEKILFSLVVVTGVVILLYRWKRPQAFKQEPQPWALDWSRSFFPVLLFVFLLRGFIAEPFRIPSGSMLPTLEIGDFILVNKFTYGIRLPILHTKVLDINEPQRGDIVVFRYPVDNKTSYIKRLIGLPGDRIDVVGRRVFVNNELIQSEALENYTPSQSRAHEQLSNFIERGDEYAKFSTIYSLPEMMSLRRQSFVVPEGQYFMMGDNRDNSSDSRKWGTVPEENIVGRAFYVWMHYEPGPNGGFDLSRIGTPIQAELTSMPTGSQAEAAQ